MVLRCSLLGHDYGEPDVEREREERGSEVVVTVQEYEQCERCGEKHVISENTEVTSLDAAADDEPVDPSPGVDDADDVAADPADTEHPAVDDDGAVSTDEDGDPVTDDAEILDDEAPPADDREREHGEWPDSDDVGPPSGAGGEPTAWPEADEDDPGGTAAIGAGDVDPEAVPDDDATFVDADPEADAAHPASEPDTDRAVAGAGPGAGGETETGTGIESARSAPAPGEGSSPEGVPTEFFCPRCDFVAPGDRGSLRAGDICPDCRKGYLSERER